VHRAYQPAPHRPSRRFSWLALVPWLFVAYLATGFYTVGTDERAVVRRCGRALPELRLPGLHFGFPYGIDRVTRLKMFKPKRVGVGMSLSERSLGRRVEPQQAEWLSGDHNLVSDAAAGALTSIATSMHVDDVLTVERLAIQDEVKRAAQETLNRYGAGVEISTVSLEGVTPPEEVAQAFRDVTAAREDGDRTVNEAQGYANRILPEARGEARRVLIEAEAYRDETTEKARGDAERFTEMAAELSTDRPLTMKRLILETMERVLPRLKKIVLDDPSTGAVDLGIIEAEP
jgi:membrane protease subunit HflK